LRNKIVPGAGSRTRRGTPRGSRRHPGGAPELLIFFRRAGWGTGAALPPGRAIRIFPLWPGHGVGPDWSGGGGGPRSFFFFSRPGVRGGGVGGGPFSETSWGKKNRARGAGRPPGAGMGEFRATPRGRKFWAPGGCSGAGGQGGRPAQRRLRGGPGCRGRAWGGGGAMGGGICFFGRRVEIVYFPRGRVLRPGGGAIWGGGGAGGAGSPAGSFSGGRPIDTNPGACVFAGQRGPWLRRDKQKISRPGMGGAFPLAEGPLKRRGRPAFFARPLLCSRRAKQGGGDYRPGRS